jgi:ATP phosphoribosyltransferase regulatory subunit
VIDQLMAALSRQKINISIDNHSELIVYTKENQANAILTAKEKRAAGTPVEIILKDTAKTNEDYQNYAKRNRIQTVIFMED